MHRFGGQWLNADSNEESGRLSLAPVERGAHRGETGLGINGVQWLPPRRAIFSGERGNECIPRPG